jgi:phospholipid/cholesterol/gamma-HCH transport system substrate-binding protein
MPKLGSLRGPTYAVRAQFSNVLNLPADAQVRYGSAVVGQVGSITTSDFKANIVLNIRKGVLLPVGTKAQVRFDSPLGDEFVLLQPPATTAHPQWLVGGATLNESDTSTAPSVEDTLSALAVVLNGGGLNQLETIVSQLNATFKGNQPALRSLLSQLGTDFKSLSAHSGDLDSALTAIAHLSAQLNAGSGVITSGIDTIGPAAHVLANENVDLQQFLTQLTKLSTVADSVISESGTQSVEDAKLLLPVVNQLVGVDNQIGPDLQNIADFESGTQKIAPGNYLQVSVILHILLNGSPETATGSGGVVASVMTTPSGSTSDTTADTSQSGNGRAVSDLLESGIP